MPFPQTLDELRKARYTFDNEAVCKGCGDEIEWWITPNGKNIPMNPMTGGNSAAVAHWATCSEEGSFRR